MVVLCDAASLSGAGGDQMSRLLCIYFARTLVSYRNNSALSPLPVKRFLFSKFEELSGPLEGGRSSCSC